MTCAYDLPPDTPGFAKAQADMARRSRAWRRAAWSGVRHLRTDLIPASASTSFPPVQGCARAAVPSRRILEARRARKTGGFRLSEWQPRGVTWIVPNYRLAPEFTLPEIVDDARAVLEWVVANGGEFGIDATRIHLVGNSAGAQLAAMVAALAPPGETFAPSR